MTILLTGFEPFRHWTVNSSGEAVRLLGAERSGLCSVVLPVDHEAAAAALTRAMAETRAETILLTGLADDPEPRLELRARRPEHLGGGDAAQHGVWPWAASLDAIRAQAGRARLSRDAGRYVCETAYWTALGAGAARRTAFLHVPPLSEDWPVARVAAAVGACLDALRG
jgi:pyroglutamyl-peptidase